MLVNVTPMLVFACALFVVYIDALPSPLVGGGATTCSNDEVMRTPCICCKKECWYNIATMATEELGHMPGEGGDDEAMQTLQLVRRCILTQCKPICASSPF